MTCHNTKVLDKVRQTTLRGSGIGNKELEV